jgi:hypothetical protein
VDSSSPDSAPPDSAPPDSTPTALADLVAAGLVSHEMIGDPARLGPEAEVLRVLCGLVPGPIWRIEPYHYAFRAAAGTDDRIPEETAAALEAALGAELGAEAVWVNATELPPQAAPLDQPILLLRAQGAAVSAGIEAAGPEVQAVVSARFAAETARIAADLAAGIDAGSPLAARLAAIEARQGEILEALAARAGEGAALARVAEALAALLPRVEAQAEALRAHVAREDMVAGRLAELSAMAGTPAAFQETLGLTLAEFLARLERRAEEGPPTRVPQFS